METKYYDVRTSTLPPLLNPNGAYEYHCAGHIWTPGEIALIYVDATSDTDPAQPGHQRPRVVGRTTFATLSKDPRFEITPVKSEPATPIEAPTVVIPPSHLNGSIPSTTAPPVTR